MVNKKRYISVQARCPLKKQGNFMWCLHGAVRLTHHRKIPHYLDIIPDIIPLARANVRISDGRRGARGRHAFIVTQTIPILRRDGNIAHICGFKSYLIFLFPRLLFHTTNPLLSRMPKNDHSLSKRARVYEPFFVAPARKTRSSGRFRDNPLSPLVGDSR